MKHAYRLAILFVGLLASLPVAAAFQAMLDHDQIQPGQSVQLILIHDGRSNTQPDIAPLKQDFAILDASSGSSVQIINGHVSAKVELRLILSPKRSGQIPIPSLTWDGDHSPALTLTVAQNTGSGNAAQGGNTGPADAPASHVFLTSTLKQKQPYVQAATTLKVRIHTDQPLYQASLDFQTSNDVRVQQIGKDQQSSETRNGRNYQVIERDYLLFPQRSGSISLPGPVLNAQVADTSADATSSDPFDRAFGNIFGRNPFSGANAVRPMRLQGDAIALDVRPRPASVSGQGWLPAQQLSLDESWKPASGSIHAGDPLTRHLRLSALGLSAAQLPDLSARMPLPDGIKAYPDQPKLSDQQQGGSVNGIREQDIALIASRAGHFQLPAMRLAWWDTATNSPREVTLPAREFEVLPSTGGSSSAPPPAEAGPAASSNASTTLLPGSISLLTTSSRMTSVWPWISLALALVWLATLAAWWRARRQRTAAPVSVGKPSSAPAANSMRIGEARKAFRQACGNNDASAARRYLLDWARATWPHDAPTGLNALARRLDDPKLTALLRELDRVCYVGGDWQGQALAGNLTVLPGDMSKTNGKALELAGLYPSSAR